MRVLSETHFAGLLPAARGKVRDIYDLGGQLLIVATDRLSAFDVILPTPIPDKGRVLTQLSLFWFQLLKDVIPNHVLSDIEFPPPSTTSRMNSEAVPWSFERRSRCRLNVSYVVTSPVQVGRTIAPREKSIGSGC